MWAVCRYDLGLQDAEAGRLTLRQIHALLARHREAEKRADYRAGILAALVSGFGGKGKLPQHFFPSLAPPRKRLSDKALVAKLHHIKAAFGKRG